IVTSVSSGSSSPKSGPLPSFSQAHVKTRRSGGLTSRYVPAAVKYSPSAFRVWMRYLPPTRGSHLAEGTVASPAFSHGTNHCLICSGSVHALNTRSRGALMRRSSFSLMFSDCIVVMTFLSFLWFVQLFDLLFPKSRRVNR